MNVETLNKAPTMKAKRPGKRIQGQADPVERPVEVLVRLEFHGPEARQVFVAGTFNNWRPGAVPMVRVEPGRWIKELRLPPGRYEYCLVVDGCWQPDPLAAESVPNPYGGLNSVLQVAGGGVEG